MAAVTSNLSQFAPVYQPISIKAPSEVEKFASKVLKTYIDLAYPQESTESRQAREKVLAKVEKLIKTLVKNCTIETGVSEDQANEGGGNIFISGSYRLGVHTEGTDIDIICCLPRQVSKDHFFGSFLDLLSARSDVSEVTPITEAVVPMIGLKIDGIDIDLLYSCLPFSQVKLKEKDILDDNILNGVDDQTAKCLNGPRVTNMLYKLVPNFEEFAICLRCLRLWGKKRGIYSNKMGYLGGVNFAILSAFICQLYPKAPAATLLKNFFRLMLDWKWPNPIRLCPKYEPGLNMEQWDPTIDRRQLRDLMPILTPAYPIMNSTYSTNQRTMEVMMMEFQRGKDICEKTITKIMLRKLKEDKLRKTYSSSSSSQSNIENDNRSNNFAMNEITDEFSELFKPFDFFSHFSTYLAICMTANTEDDLLKWEGFVESRVRQLVMKLGYLPFSAVRPHPKVLHDDEKNKLASNGNGVFSAMAFIGIETDPNRAKGEIQIGRPIQTFKDAPKFGVMNWNGRKEGMSVEVKILKFKDLPSFIFPKENGGKQEAKKRHKIIRKRIKEAYEKERLKKEQEKQALLAATTWTRKTSTEEQKTMFDNNGSGENDDNDNSNSKSNNNIKTNDVANETEDNNNNVKGVEDSSSLLLNGKADDEISSILDNSNIGTDINEKSKVFSDVNEITDTLKYEMKSANMVETDNELNSSSANDDDDNNNNNDNKQISIGDHTNDKVKQKRITELNLLKEKNKEEDDRLKEEMRNTIDLNSMFKQSKKRKNNGRTKKRKKMRCSLKSAGSIQEF